MTDSLVREIGTLTSRVTRLNTAVDFWNQWMVAGLIVAAFAAMWVVVTTRLVIVRGKELADAQGLLNTAKEAKLNLDLKEKDIQIANAGTASSQALQQARAAEAQLADAHARASEAYERAQEAEARTAEAQLALAKLKTPRTLSEDQMQQIATKISAYADTPYDLWVSTDAEAVSLLGRIDFALQSAKWQFNQAGTVQFSNRAGLISSSGVSIHIDKVDNPKLVPAAQALGAALNDAGIPIATIYVDEPGQHQGMTAGRIHVWVGSKPLD